MSLRTRIPNPATADWAHVRVWLRSGPSMPELLAFVHELEPDTRGIPLDYADAHRIAERNAS